MNLKLSGSVPNFQSDGLSITAAEPWFKVKVQLIQSYLQAFMMNASQKTTEIIFVDLFSGSGLYSCGHKKEIFAGSCLASLTAETPFQHRIFCEEDVDHARALDKRVKKFFPDQRVTVLNVGHHEWMESLQSIIPASKPGYKVAVICLADPFSMNIPFGAVNKLAALGYSFLIPFTFPLNTRVDCRYYSREHPDLLKKYIGDGNYERLAVVESNVHFYRKLVRMYQNNMLVMGQNSALSSHKLDSRMMELPAYYIGFFSKQFSTQAIQRDVNVSEHLQFELFK